jgi:hypothetical protein
VGLVRRSVDQQGGRPPRGSLEGRGPPKADTYFKKLPKEFTIDHVRKIDGKASAISLAQWARRSLSMKVRQWVVRVTAVQDRPERLRGLS